MIAFIDTEVNPQTKKVADYGAVREDGSVLHSHSKADFDAFVSKCDTLCGHNIINFDLKYTSLRGNPTIVDTLFLSPLLFPKRPYHHLVKDDKLQVDELNNPVNDSMKARDLLNDEMAAWNQLTDNRKEIYYYLLNETQEFGGFFKYIGYSPNVNWISSFFSSQPDWKQLILKEYEGKVCSHADFKTLVKQCPVELAYCLAVIGADDIFSITPAWVTRNYPQVVNVMNMMCNTSCGDCEYCHPRLDAHYGLKEFFGYDEFRIFDGVPMQQQAVESAIRGESLLTIFPTGGGKSLTFQLPALMAGRNTHGLTVVISPCSRSNKSRNASPKIGISTMRKENCATDSFFTPQSSPVAMVVPLRLNPGRTAIACAQPMMMASRYVISCPCRLRYLARNSLNHSRSAVTTRHIPTKSKPCPKRFSTLSLKNIPTMNTGIIDTSIFAT